MSRELNEYVSWLRAELEALSPLADEAVSVQWEKAPRPSGDSVRRRAERPDPTADVALDPARLALRRQLETSAALMEASIIRVRGVRIGLERSLEPYRGRE